MRVLGYHISEREVINSDKEELTHFSLVEYLLQPKNDTIRILYDLDYSINFLLSSLKFTSKEEKVLKETTKFRLPPYYFRYVVGKFLSIKRTNAFSYFSNASQYIKCSTTDLTLNSFILAERARETGELVKGILEELGIETTSLTSPARAYEKAQVEYLYNEMQKSADNVIRRSIIDSIGLEVFGRTWETHLQGGSLNGTYNKQ